MRSYGSTVQSRTGRFVDVSVTSSHAVGTAHNATHLPHIASYRRQTPTMRLLPTVLIIIWVSLLQATNAESIKQAVPEEGHPDVDNPDTAATTTTTTTTGDTVTTDTPPESIAEEEKEESREQEVASHDTSNTGIRVPDTNTHPSRPKDVGANPKEERPQTVDPDNPASQHHTGGKQRLWGAPTTPHEDDIPKEEQTGKEEHHHNLHIHPPPRDDGSHVQEEHEPANQHQHHNVHIPFVPKSAHPPPPGYLISARVYIDPEDKLGHIDEDPLTLPYWDCGAVGSTTSPLKVADVAFRHSLTPSQGWTGTDGKHPVLAIAVSINCVGCRNLHASLDSHGRIMNL